MLSICQDLYPDTGSSLKSNQSSVYLVHSCYSGKRDAVNDYDGDSPIPEVPAADLLVL